MLTDIFLESKQAFMKRPQGNKFVPGGCNVHMPRHEFLALLHFNGDKQCHICSVKAYLVVDHSHRYPNLIRGLLCNECNLEVGRFENGHYVRGPLWEKIKSYLDNPPALQLRIVRHYQAYYPEQNEGKAAS